MPGSDPGAERLGAIVAALSIGRADRHLLLCAGQSTPRCSERDRSLAVWSHLKRRLKEEGLTSAPPSAAGERGDGAPASRPGQGRVLRSKVDCLRICEQGPIAVVYPEGVWYRLVDEAAVDRIVEEHLRGGRVVADLVFARAPLPAGIESPGGASQDRGSP